MLLHLRAELQQPAEAIQLAESASISRKGLEQLIVLREKTGKSGLSRRLAGWRSSNRLRLLYLYEFCLKYKR